MRKKKRLLWQLFPSYLLIVLISLVAVTLYATTSLKHFYLDQVADDLQVRAHLLEKQILQLIGPLDAEVIDELSKEIGKLSATRITVILPSGTVIGDSNDNPARMDNHAMRPEVIEARKGLVGTSIRYSTTLQQKMMYVAIPLSDGDNIMAVIRTCFPVTTIDKKLKSIQVKIVFGGLLIALLAAVLSLYVSRRISQPIEKLKEGSEHFARGDLSYRLPETDLEEIGSLAETLNQMAGQLDDRINTILNQRNELEAVLSSMEEGVIAFDVDERIISVNQAAARIFGLKTGDFLNRTVQEAVRNPELQQFVKDALSTSENLESDITHYHEGERIIHIHSTSLFDSTGHSSGILVVLNDVTQLRQLENMRRDFAANVSHEIKTPLTAIKGFVETLRYSCNEKPEDTERFIDIIDKHVNRLAAIVDDLISLSKIEQDDEKEEITLQKSLLRTVLQAAAGNCQEKADQKEITIDIDCDKNISAMIDATLMEQAIFNLLDNAINYSERKNTVQVSVSVQDTETIISVQDHGIGIDKEHIPRLFERFYRVDKARSRTLGGTGLGLAIVKHIAQAHGGHVTIESELGKGSKFSIHLPESYISSFFSNNFLTFL
jgi:two-component system phosphate regulon sensor histidine kinase PhoR